MDLLLRPTSPGVLLVMISLTRLVVSEHRKLLQTSQWTEEEEEEEEPYFVDYVPPARDAMAFPRNAAYILVGAVLVVVATYAIVGHLIKDLMHDLAGNPTQPPPPPTLLRVLLWCLQKHETHHPTDVYLSSFLVPVTTMCPFFLLDSSKPLVCV